MTRVTRVFVSPDYTRTNPYQQLLADGLRDRAVDVEPVAIHGPFMPIRALNDRGVPDVLHLHWLHPFLLGRHAAFTLTKAVLFFSQLALFRALGVRIVWTAHNVTEHDPRHPFLERVLKHLVVRGSDAVIIHCEDVADRVLSAYLLPDRYRDRLHVVPHGHYCDVYENDVSRAEARADLGLDDEFTFCFFGRVCGYKNVPGLVEAFGNVTREDARLFVVGNPENETIESRVRRVADRDCRVETNLQFVDPDRVQYYMNAADVVVLPFREILTSGSTILAMSFGKPVVVPDAGCVATVMPADGGFTYPEDGHRALTRALERAMEAELDAVGQANREAVEALDWDHVARLTAQAYTGE